MSLSSRTKGEHQWYGGSETERRETISKYDSEVSDGEAKFEAGSRNLRKATDKAALLGDVAAEDYLAGKDRFVTAATGASDAASNAATTAAMARNAGAVAGNRLNAITDDVAGSYASNANYGSNADYSSKESYARPGDVNYSAPKGLDYTLTDKAGFQRDSEAARRQAVGAARSAGGGGGGIRAALLAQAGGNAQAQQNAAITRANQINQNNQFQEQTALERASAIDKNTLARTIGADQSSLDRTYKQDLSGLERTFKADQMGLARREAMDKARIAAEIGAEGARSAALSAAGSTGAVATTASQNLMNATLQDREDARKAQADAIAKEQAGQLDFAKLASGKVANYLGSTIDVQNAQLASDNAHQGRRTGAAQQAFQIATHPLGGQL